MSIEPDLAASKSAWLSYTEICEGHPHGDTRAIHSRRRLRLLKQ